MPLERVSSDAATITLSPLDGFAGSNPSCRFSCFWSQWHSTYTTFIPKWQLGVPDLNDSVLVLLATELAVQAITGEQNLTDPWLATVGMGFPLFHHYQH